MNTNEKLVNLTLCVACKCAAVLFLQFLFNIFEISSQESTYVKFTFIFFPKND